MLCNSFRQSHFLLHVNNILIRKKLVSSLIATDHQITLL
nr:MAG TPA: hypothetical protein [Caudoviricetes sp.]